MAKTTFWLTFTDPEATSDQRFLGVAIFDMDESEGQLSTVDIIRHAYALGLNPGGTVSVQEVFHKPSDLPVVQSTRFELVINVPRLGCSASPCRTSCSSQPTR